MLMLLVIVQVPQPGKSKVRLTFHNPPQVELFVSASQVACVPLPLIGNVPEAAVVFWGASVMPDPVVAAGL